MPLSSMGRITASHAVGQSSNLCRGTIALLIGPKS